MAELDVISAKIITGEASAKPKYCTVEYFYVVKQTLIILVNSMSTNPPHHTMRGNFLTSNVSAATNKRKVVILLSFVVLFQRVKT